MTIATLCIARDARADDTGAATDTLPSAALVASGAFSSQVPLDTVIHDALDKLGVVRIAVSAGLDLEAVQLATDCVDQTAECLGAAASASGVDILVIPQLEQDGEEFVLKIMRFDSRGDASLREVVHRNIDSHALFAEVPDMLRVLFELEAAAPAPPADTAPPDEPQIDPGAAATTVVPASIAAPDPAPVHAKKRPVLVGPILLGSAGVLALGGGVIAGSLMLDAEHDYSRGRLRSGSQADRAIDARSRGETQALVANVFYGIGAVATVAAAVWLTLELTGWTERRSANRTTVQAAVGPDQLGLRLVHHGSAL